MEVTGKATIRDYAWAALAVLMATCAALNLVGSLIVLLGGGWTALIGAPIGLLFAYWIGMGAWRRTVWGRPPESPGPAGPPELSADRARRFVLLAAACSVVLALAFSLQVLVGRS